MGQKSTVSCYITTTSSSDTDANTLTTFNADYPDLYVKTVGAQGRAILTHRATIMVRALEQMAESICGAGVLALTDAMHITEPSKWVSAIKKTRSTLRAEVSSLMREAQGCIIHMGAAGSEMEKDEYAVKLERTLGIIEHYLKHYGQYFDVTGIELNKKYPRYLLRGCSKH